MSDALYVAATGMQALQRVLDNAAQNVVNSTTPGYQRQRIQVQNFGDILSEAEGRQNLIGVKQTIAFEQGELVNDKSPFAVALEGKGFLGVNDAKGGVHYTRNGDLTVNAVGLLMTRAGYPVRSETGGDITINPTLGQTAISRDGSIIQGDAVIGKLEVVEFSDADRQRLKVTGDTLYAAPAGVSPQPAVTTTVNGGFLEFPKFKAPFGLIEMITAQRNYEGMQRAIRAASEVDQSLLRAVT